MKLKPYVVARATFPTHKADVLQERIPEAFKKYPRDAVGSTLVKSIFKRSHRGYTNIVITEPLEGKLEAELELQMNRQSVYNDIEGYESKVEVYYEVIPE